jgi:septal ring factor EnvC (AmiA/AmiB activator)
MVYETSANVALISAVGAAVCAALTVGLPLLTKRRMEARRLTISAVRNDADRLEGSYQRLERENDRLTGEVADLRERIRDLETAVQVERDQHYRTQVRCEQMESTLRRLGHLPPQDTDGPDENGGSR